jgi:hypothetical protein
MLRLDDCRGKALEVDGRGKGGEKKKIVYLL